MSNVWEPIENYRAGGRRLIFIDADDFIFIGEGTMTLGKLVVTGDDDFKYEPTHFMKMPEPPKRKHETGFPTHR